MRVTLDGIGQRFGNGSWLFRGLSFEFVPDQVYALSGPSGSGKSTLLALLAKSQKPVEGQVIQLGIDTISRVFQNPNGVPRRTALDHVVLPLLAAGLSRTDAETTASALMDRFALDRVTHRRFRDLSGGEAQRLMLARALARNPQLLLIDEPTAQLDRTTAAQVDAVIGSAAGPRTIVVVATHDSRTRESCTAHLDLGEFAAEAGR